MINRWTVTLVVLVVIAIELYFVFDFGNTVGWGFRAYSLVAIDCIVDILMLSFAYLYWRLF